MTTLTQSTTALQRAAQLWYLTTAIGMWLFVYYIAAFYGPTVSGDFEAWNANRMLTHGYVAGDAAGNLMFAVHFLLAGVLTLGGTIQLIPQLRRHALALHQWNGRLFMVTALLVSVAGLGLNILRRVDKHGDTWPSAIDFNGLLILAFAAVAWMLARRGQTVSHRRWALRTFMVVSGVWFLRIGVSLWILSTATLYGAPHYVNEFFAVWKWGCFLFPLLVLEGYFWAQKSEMATARYFITVLLVIFSLLTAIGTFGAYKVFWGPLL